MFRAQANPMDDAVVKATDENLTSENWEYILDVCDRVQASSQGPPHAVSALIKRLAHRNANVQLYTLELANALSQNCGPPLHRELASKAFTDALLRLANDRNTHAQVKQKVLERMASWSDEFRKDPDLGIMEQAYQRLRTSQPGLMPPSKPGKQQISSDDRRKEEEELQMALALSVQDKGGNQATSPGRDEGPGAATERDDSEPQPAQAQPGAQPGTTAATVSRVKALYDFTPSEPGELAFRKDDVIAVLESVYKDWWKGSLRGQTGIFPLNYVEKLQDPTKEDLERDANMEAEVFGEIKNVEKLLALLSVRDGGGSGRRGEREEEEIGDLYQRTLSIRPKLIELIGRYSQKKDDFTQLNEKFIKARRDYEALLESSMSHPYQQQQQQHHQFPIRTPQASHPMYPPPQQRQPYGAPPPAGYPPQGPPPSSAHGYPPHQPPFAAAQSHPHLPQQDPQRFYSPAPPPSDPPLSAGGAPPQQPPQGFVPSPYPPHDGPPMVNGGGGASAPFHFIPGGVQQQHQHLPPPSSHQQQPQQQQEVRRKPSPQDFGAAPLPSGGPAADVGGGGGGGGGVGFQGQIRPNSIHTLNRGDPQELATSVYESPVDHQSQRGSYPVGGGGAEGYVPPQQQQFPQQQGVGGGPPSGAPPPPQGDNRESFYQYPPAPPHPVSGGGGVPDSPSAAGGGGGGGGPAHMMSPSSPPASAGMEQGSAGPGGPGGAGGYGPPPSAGYQYQAYQPPPPQQQQQVPPSQGELGWSQQQYPQHEQQRLPIGSSSVGGDGGADPGDFYR
ncbi:Class E vacuolar protein-sorting machinery protein [Hortaea werneckii]|nr:Class E vacuolar protein-sorting machinery protein [Hortaea werneckii]KAI7245572.1 Class E vacuolar protein-sorting machinery protein [Hortaea werneckii]KAI7482093.1 Class E vacuolar protein-sorting machinery protein [Hortaea werneckii]